jgi:hypothetical protein
MLTLEKLCEIINSNFGEPYLISGGVTAEIIEDEEDVQLLSINIGRRDIQINTQGEIVGSGTFLSMANNTLELNEEDL